MIQHILLTPEIKSAMPDSVKITHNFGEINVRFSSLEDGGEPLILTGDNAVVEGDTQEFINWLKPFDGVAIGVGGSPQFEQFEIMYIKEEL